MCGPEVIDFLQEIPKCEHHIHIEGSLSPSLLFELSAKNNIALPSENPAFASIEALEQRYLNFADLQDFLDYYYLAMSTLLLPADFENLMYNYLVKASSDGVLHAEIFFDPQAHTGRGIAIETVIDGLEAGIKEAQREFDISVNLIMCFLRHLPATAAVATFNTAREAGYLSKAMSSIVGVGLDSAEVPFPPELFHEVYANAKEAGLQLTAHAGEEGPASYIASALDTLGVSRIDHGLRLIEDPGLVRRIVDDKVLLTLCPLSNVCLKAVNQVADLPIPEFLRLGVKFSINSDDPAYFGGYILDNYIAVQRAFRLTHAQWYTICENGIMGSWCSNARKASMMKQLNVVMSKYT